MEKFVQPATLSTPKVDLDPNSGVFKLIGKSVPEDGFSFYKPIFDWLEEYENTPCDTTTVHISLEYFNTNSSKFLLDFFFRLVNIHKDGKSSVTIHWYANDDDLIEAGNDYAAIVHVPMKVVQGSGDSI